MLQLIVPMLIQRLAGVMPPTLTEEQLAQVPTDLRSKIEEVVVRCACGRPQCTGERSLVHVLSGPVSEHDGHTLRAGIHMRGILSNVQVSGDTRARAGVHMGLVILTKTNETTEDGKVVWSVFQGAKEDEQLAVRFKDSMLQTLGLPNCKTVEEFDNAVVGLLQPVFAPIGRAAIADEHPDAIKAIDALAELTSMEPEPQPLSETTGERYQPGPATLAGAAHQTLRVAIESVLPEGVRYLSGDWTFTNDELQGNGTFDFGHVGDISIQIPARAFMRMAIAKRFGVEDGFSEMMSRTQLIAEQRGDILIQQAGYPLIFGKVLPEENGEPAFEVTWDVQDLLVMAPSKAEELKAIIGRIKALEAVIEKAVYRHGRARLDIVLRLAAEANVPVKEVYRQNVGDFPHETPAATSIDAVLGQLTDKDGNVYGVHFPVCVFLFSQSPEDVNDLSDLDMITFVKQNPDGTYLHVDDIQEDNFPDFQARLVGMHADFFGLSYPPSFWKEMLTKFDDLVLAEDDPILDVARTANFEAQPVTA